MSRIDEKGTNVTHPEHSAKTPPAGTGSCATLRAFFSVKGSGAPSSLLPTCLLVFVALIALLPPVASADSRLGSEGDAAGQLHAPSGLAVSDKEGGDVYVDDTANQRIDQFDPSMPPSEQFVRAFGWGVADGTPELQTCTVTCQVLRDSGGPVIGPAPGQLTYSRELAVDNDPSSASYGDLYVIDQNRFRVQKYSPDGKFLLMFGGEVDKTTGADVCTAEDVEVKHDTCGTGAPGTGPSHFYEEDPPTGGGGEFAAKTWFQAGNNSIAVGPDGTVYVGDYGRIQEFEPDGTFAGELSLPDGGDPQFVSSIAVGSNGNIYEHSETHYRGGASPTQVLGVREYNTEVPRKLVRTFDAGPEENGSEPTHIVLDGKGDLFVSDANGSEAEPPTGEFRFRAFKPGGAPYAEFTADQVGPTFANNGDQIGPPRAEGIAIGDAPDKLYATSENPEGAHVAVHMLPVEGPPSVTEQKVTDVEPTTATLQAVINPEQFDTEYQFEYTSTDFTSCGLSVNPSCLKTPAAPVDLGSVSKDHTVQAAISNLTSATTYHWRVVATSECEPSSNPGHICVTAPEKTFTALSPVSVRNFTTQTVAPELVELKAELDPNNSATHYTILYGTQVGDYSAGSLEGSLGIGNKFEEVTATFANLQPDTTYHYQLIATNGNGPGGHGEVKTADQAFTTELSSAEERAAEDCPENGTVHGEVRSTLREESPSLALPDCRAYEQVSPIAKAGYGVVKDVLPDSPPNQLAPDGERDVFGSEGSFSGATATGGSTSEYVAHRTAAGWFTRPIIYQAGPGQAAGRFELSAELDNSVLSLVPINSAGIPEVVLNTRSADGSLGQPTLTFSSTEDEPIEGSHFEPVAQSSDFSRLYIATNYPLLASDERPAFKGSPAVTDRIYELEGVGTGSTTLRLVAELPLDLTESECLIDESVGRESSWASVDGSTLFYTSPLDLGPGVRCSSGALESGPNVAALFVATGTAAPIQLSAPALSTGQCTAPHPCASSSPAIARYDGSSPDGSRAWFTTSQPLVDSDGDKTEDLYLAKLENGQLAGLVQASAGETAAGHVAGQDAGVQGVVKASPDGSRTAFVATGVLTTQPDEATGETAALGADNLYLYDAGSGETKFVARLCSGPEESGSLEEPACPADLSSEGGGVRAENDHTLWGLRSGSESQLTPDGRYLLFSSWGRLTADDTDNVPDVYRYDFQSGRLLRLSFGRDGNDGNGNDDVSPATIAKGDHFAGLKQRLLNGAAEDATRSISADGSTVVFQTPAPLVSHDTNAGPHPGCGEVKGQIPGTGCDIYQWQESGHGTCHEAGGCISLVSDGVFPQGAADPVISSSGRDISFITSADLAVADTDGVPDVYDAREGGGFHYVRPASPCEGNEPCHGPGPPNPPPPNISTPNFIGPGNELEKLHCGRGRHRVEKHGQVRCIPNKHRPHKKRHLRSNANRGGAR